MIVKESMSRTIHIFDIDTTLANNDERAKLLVCHCARCGKQCLSSDNNHQSSWYCDVCGPVGYVIPQSACDSFIAPDKMVLDKPIPQAQKYMNRLISAGAEIHFITGRREDCREVTTRWISDHYCYSQERSYLMMRGGDHYGYCASLSKEQSFQDLTKKINSDIRNDLFYFYEDDKFVFSMYEKYGIVMQSPEVFTFMCSTGHPRVLEKAWAR